MFWMRKICLNFLKFKLLENVNLTLKAVFEKADRAIGIFKKGKEIGGKSKIKVNSYTKCCTLLGF